jgi:hypothetical protein
METEKPKSIKTIGIAIMVISAFIIFSNGMGAIASTLIGLDGITPPGQPEPQTTFAFIIAHYLELCLLMVAIGIAYLFGGLFIQKYKLWANRFVTAISGFLILLFWTTMLIMRASFSQEPGFEFANTWTIVAATVWSAPFGLLIWFLNRKDIVTCFE